MYTKHRHERNHTRKAGTGTLCKVSQLSGASSYIELTEENQFVTAVCGSGFGLAYSVSVSQIAIGERRRMLPRAIPTCRRGLEFALTF
jgi:hypothetical protein